MIYANRNCNRSATTLSPRVSKLASILQQKSKEINFKSANGEEPLGSERKMGNRTWEYNLKNIAEISRLSKYQTDFLSIVSILENSVIV